MSHIAAQWSNVLISTKYSNFYITTTPLCRSVTLLALILPTYVGGGGVDEATNLTS